MIWSFFQNNGGQEYGFNDAGVETFKGNLAQYVAREIIQNSLDARDDQKKPVLVKFEVSNLTTSDIPDMKSLATTFGRCAKFWPKDPKASKFFEEAQRLARAKKVVALKCSDFNTIGVSGSDSNRGAGWYSLIRSSGASSKWAGEGGSFGIGKNAPFAASWMRTVFYSTLTKNRDVAFQGVARLVSHEHPKGGIAQHVGYLGDKKGASIREKKFIPSTFSRSKPGTDVIILGYNAEASWKEDLVYSVLENFWPAIHFGDLEVEVSGTRINRSNLAKLLAQHSTEGEFTAHHYYRAFTDNAAVQFEDKLPTLGKVSVHLVAGDGLPKKVAMVRRTGMVIYHDRFRSLVPYCGVFFCRNKRGNEILREMEPPRHDFWDQHHPEKNAHRKTALEFTAYIRDCISQLAPADNEKVLNVPELSQYLPDDDDSPDEGFEGESEKELSKKESFQRQPEVKTISARKLDRSRKQMQPDESKAGDGDLDTELAGAGFGSGGGAGSGLNDGEDGTGAGGGGAGQGSGTEAGFGAWSQCKTGNSDP